MSFIGRIPANAALTASDLADDVITLAKIAGGTDGNIISYDASGDPVAVATGSAAQVLTSAGAGAPPTFATVTIPDNSVTNSKVASTVITGQTAASTIADDDLILISDTGESAALKKMTRANFVAGIGGTNDNRWFASNNGDQTVNHNTVTTIAFDNQVIDSAGAYASNTLTVPSGQGGTYLVGAGLWTYDTADRIVQQDLYITSNLGAASEDDIGFFSNRPEGAEDERIYMNLTLLLNLSAAQTLNVRLKPQTGDSGSVLVSGSGAGSRFRNFFWGYKLIT